MLEWINQSPKGIDDMLLYPEIEIRQGKCAHLNKRRYDDPTIYEVSPLEAAKEFERLGAEWIHIIDLDAAFNYENDNQTIIEEIIRTSNIPVQVGGGIRSMTTVDRWVNHGASRVVIGTEAVINHRFVDEACIQHPERIILSIDSRSGWVLTHGWQQESTFTAITLAKRFEHSGVAAIIYTDIDKYENHETTSISATIEISKAISRPIISSGTVRHLEDIQTLSHIKTISGAIVGWSFFNNEISFEDALSASKGHPPKP